MRKILGAVVLGLAVVSAPVQADYVREACSVASTMGGHFTLVKYNLGTQDRDEILAEVAVNLKMDENHNFMPMMRRVVYSVHKELPLSRHPDMFERNLEFVGMVAESTCRRWFMEQR